MSMRRPARSAARNAFAEKIAALGDRSGTHCTNHWCFLSRPAFAHMLQLYTETDDDWCVCVFVRVCVCVRVLVARRLS